MEKLFGILQDRLGAELGLEGITTIEEANRFLKRFVKRFNRRFALSAQQGETAWRVAPKNLDRIISFRYHATVGNDNTVRLGGLLIDIPPGPGQRSYAKAKVEVRQWLTGAWQLYYQDRLIAKHAPTPLREPGKVFPRKKPSARGVSSDHWVYLASAPPKEQDTAVARSL